MQGCYGFLDALSSELRRDARQKTSVFFFVSDGKKCQVGPVRC